MYDNPSREEIIRCQKLLKAFKDAVVSDEDNMFILRDLSPQHLTHLLIW